MSIAVAVEIHPLADLVPGMSDGEYVDLRDNIAEKGLLDSITLYEDKVLDGRHRLRACEETNTEPRFEQYDGDEPASFVLSHNLHRRNLSESQKAMLAVEFLPALEAEAKKRQGRRTDLDPTSAPRGAEVSVPAPRASQRAADKTGSKQRTVEKAKRVREADPGLAEKVLQGEVKVGTAEKQLIAEGKIVTEAKPAPKPEKGRRMPGAIERIAAQLDSTLMSLEELALRKSCDGLNSAQRQKAADTFKKAASKFNALAKTLAASEKESTT